MSQELVASIQLKSQERHQILDELKKFEAEKASGVEAFLAITAESLSTTNDSNSNISTVLKSATIKIGEDNETLLTTEVNTLAEDGTPIVGFNGEVIMSSLTAAVFMTCTAEVTITSIEEAKVEVSSNDIESEDNKTTDTTVESASTTKTDTKISTLKFPLAVQDLNRGQSTTLSLNTKQDDLDYVMKVTVELTALEDMILGKKLELERCGDEFEALAREVKAVEEKAAATAAATTSASTASTDEKSDPPTTKIVRKSTNSSSKAAGTNNSPKRKKKQTSGWTSKVTNYAKQTLEKVDPALILGLTIQNRGFIFFGVSAVMIYAYGDFLSV